MTRSDFVLIIQLLSILDKCRRGFLSLEPLELVEAPSYSLSLGFSVPWPDASLKRRLVQMERTFCSNCYGHCIVIQLICTSGSLGDPMWLHIILICHNTYISYFWNPDSMPTYANAIFYPTALVSRLFFLVRVWIVQLCAHILTIL